MKKLIDQEQFQRRVDDETVEIAFYAMPQALIDDDNILNEATGVDSVSGDGSAYLETVRNYILQEEDEKLGRFIRENAIDYLLRLAETKAEDTVLDQLSLEGFSLEERQRVLVSVCDTVKVLRVSEKLIKLKAKQKMIRNQKIVENRTKHPRMLENVRYTLSQVAIITGINISTIHRRVGRRDFLIEDDLKVKESPIIWPRLESKLDHTSQEWLTRRIV